MNSFLTYIFGKAPGSEMKFYIPLIILTLALIFGSLIFSRIYKKKRKQDFAFKRCFKRTSKIMLILGVILGFLVIVRYENIPYFAMRIWLYITLLLILFFTYWYIKIYLVNYNKEKQNSTKPKEKTQKNVYTTSKKKK